MITSAKLQRFRHISEHEPRHLPSIRTTRQTQNVFHNGIRSHWLFRGHMTLSNKTFSLQRSLILWAGKIHCKIYHDTKLSGGKCWPREDLLPCEQRVLCLAILLHRGSLQALRSHSCGLSVANKPTTRLTSHANDFVNAKRQEREKSLLAG